MPLTVITEADAEGVFETRVGESVSIRLPENPTTGHQWEVQELDDRILTLQQSSFAVAVDGGIGGGGVHTFVLISVAAGTTRIRLALQRAWAPDEVAGRFAVTVHVH